MSKKKTVCEQMLYLLENDADNWKQEHYTLDHKAGFRLWTTSIQPFDIELHSHGIKFNLIEKIRLMFAIRRVNKYKKLIDVDNR